MNVVYGCGHCGWSSKGDPPITGERHAVMSHAWGCSRPLTATLEWRVGTSRDAIIGAVNASIYDQLPLFDMTGVYA